MAVPIYELYKQIKNVIQRNRLIVVRQIDVKREIGISLYKMKSTFEESFNNDESKSSAFT